MCKKIGKERRDLMVEVDNILVNVQFSYACDYYSERYKIYAGEDIFEKDEFVIENILRFVKAALKMNENL
jgi:hypothetical protein